MQQERLSFSVCVDQATPSSQPGPPGTFVQEKDQVESCADQCPSPNGTYAMIRDVTRRAEIIVSLMIDSGVVGTGGWVEESTLGSQITWKAGRDSIQGCLQMPMPVAVFPETNISSCWSNTLDRVS